MQLELSMIEQFARLVEAVEEAKRSFAVTVERMESASEMQGEVKEAAGALHNNWGLLPAIIARLADQECLGRHRAALLVEIKRLSIGQAESDLSVFLGGNLALLKKHGIVA